MLAITTRAEILLRTLIERYIADGHPVGSRTLARQAGLVLSPATVRNVMVDLEEMGLVHSPHTSSGRVPTQLGYRMFVDSLLKVRSLTAAQLRKLEGELASIEDPQQLIGAASSMLSQITRLAAVVMVPRREGKPAFRQIDFVGLSANRVLVILVTEDGQVQNRVIHTDREYSPSELVQAGNYFSRTYAGLSLGEVKRALLSELQADSESMQRMMSVAVAMARKMLSEDSGDDDDLVVSGESNLMEIPELGDLHKLRKLFDAFTAKRDLLHLLDRSIRAGGIKIFIGSESGYDAFKDCSVVTAPYRTDKEVVGTLGVVGPTRMAYEQVIPIVDMTAKLLGVALSQDYR